MLSLVNDSSIRCTLLLSAANCLLTAHVSRMCYPLELSSLSPNHNARFLDLTLLLNNRRGKKSSHLPILPMRPLPIPSACMPTSIKSRIFLYTPRKYQYAGTTKMPPRVSASGQLEDLFFYRKKCHRPLLPDHQLNE